MSTTRRSSDCADQSVNCYYDEMNYALEKPKISYSARSAGAERCCNIIVQITGGNHCGSIQVLTHDTQHEACNTSKQRTHTLGLRTIQGETYVSNIYLDLFY